MPVSFRCPQCDKSLRAKEEYRGRKTKCPQCGHVVPIPVDVRSSESDPISAPPESVRQEATSLPASLPNSIPALVHLLNEAGPDDIDRFVRDLNDRASLGVTPNTIGSATIHLGCATIQTGHYFSSNSHGYTQHYAVTSVPVSRGAVLNTKHRVTCNKCGVEEPVTVISKSLAVLYKIGCFLGGGLLSAASGYGWYWMMFANENSPLTQWSTSPIGTIIGVIWWTVVIGAFFFPALYCMSYEAIFGETPTGWLDRDQPKHSLLGSANVKK